MFEPTAVLMDEHRVIEKVLQALETASRRKMSVAFYEKAIDFIARFADGCHHAKEESQLFPILEERGIPREAGPIGCMLEEHEDGRASVRRMRALIAAGDHDGLRKETLAYAALLRAHIAKEDNVLFPMGRNVLTLADRDRLQAGFRETPTCTKGRHTDYVALAESLLVQAQAGA
ncbi:MAG: hemerythrin domain-containing protein [Planctomycetaceae bacterium]